MTTPDAGMTILSILALGFLLGMRHAMEGDHLAAVATLATRSRSFAHAVQQGVAWGTGHTFTLMLFGGAVLVLGVVVPTQAAQALELAVGVMLVLLGTDVLFRLRRERAHFNGHRHADGVAYFHARSYQGERALHDPERHEYRHSRRFPARALLVGMVHGMAGTAALILLSLQDLKSTAWGFAYVAIFGLGSILGMALLSVAIAVPLSLTSRHLSRVYDGLSATIGLATLLLGCYMVLGFGFGEGIIGLGVSDSSAR